jgi:hypothetical protein
MFPGHYDVRHLKLLAPGEQYTTFRYKPVPDGRSTIIKRAHVDTSTLKYMLREKAMLGYLRHDNIAKLESSFSPALDLFVEGAANFTDTFVQHLAILAFVFVTL